MDKGCRVCGEPEEHTNLFYNVHKELLKNLKSLLGEELSLEISPDDTHSKWICRTCVETVESFINFRIKFQETTKMVTQHLQNSIYDPLQPHELISIIEEEKKEIVEGDYWEYSHHDSEELQDDILEEIHQNGASEFEEDEEDPEFLPEVIQEDAQKLDLNPRSKARNNSNHENAERSNLECNICSKSYSSQCVLQRHMRTKHGHVLIPCPRCPKTFTQQSSLDNHCRRFHKTDTIVHLDHRCPEKSCAEQTFKTVQDLSQHITQHTKDREQASKRPPAAEAEQESPTKKYRKQCNVCGLRVKQINEHMLTHQGSRIQRSSKANSVKPRKSYTAKFKLKTLDDLKQSNMKPAQFAKMMGIEHSNLSYWKSNEAKLRTAIQNNKKNGSKRKCFKYLT